MDGNNGDQGRLFLQIPQRHCSTDSRKKVTTDVPLLLKFNVPVHFVSVVEPYYYVQTLSFTRFDLCTCLTHPHISVYTADGAWRGLRGLLWNTHTEHVQTSVSNWRHVPYLG